MRESRQIIQRWHKGIGAILVTLVRVQGSSYRQPGARLMICNDGTYEGSISAGCLESDVLRKAAWQVRDGAVVESYSTLLDDMAEMPFGLGCGGVLDILLEPVATTEGKAILEALEASLGGRERVVVTWLPKPGRSLLRAIFDAEGELLFASEALSTQALLQAHAQCFDQLEDAPPELFVERLLAPQRLFVFGAGDDARPLVDFASTLGWSVTVLDGRAHLARKDRFPEARVIVPDLMDQQMSQIGNKDAVVLMTHSYEQDRDVMQAVLPQQPRYFGLLGSRKRSSLLITEVASRLEWPLTRCCDAVNAPIGLDIGGEGPEAIALAIIAEIQACCMGKQIDPRKLSVQYVESAVSEGNARLYLQSQCGLSIA